MKIRETITGALAVAVLVLAAVLAFGRAAEQHVVSHDDALIQVTQEFVDMSRELEALNDGKVDAIMEPHLNKVNQIMEKYANGPSRTK